MPLHWDRYPDGAPASPGAFSFAAGTGPAARLTLWPHRSLPHKGFAAVILATFVMILLPVLPLLGTPVLWGLLPFLMGAVALLWTALRRSYADGALREEFALWSDRVELVRLDPRGSRQEWHANPHWVSVELHETGGPVENYVTLKGGGREVEIGAFLSPDERIALREQLARALQSSQAPA